MTFDPNDFLNATITESNDTALLNPPDNMSGDGYQMIADKATVAPWQGKADPSKSGLKLEIQWQIEDENVKKFCGREKVMCRQSIMLDLNDSGGLDLGKGRNIGLGKLREALGMNVPGVPFSFQMISGRMAQGYVQHRVDGENVYAEIKRVAKL
jgi:hypothetical protein